jgi:hypothetical protein
MRTEEFIALDTRFFLRKSEQECSFSLRGGQGAFKILKDL